MRRIVPTLWERICHLNTLSWIAQLIAGGIGAGVLSLWAWYLGLSGTVIAAIAVCVLFAIVWLGRALNHLIHAARRKVEPDEVALAEWLSGKEDEYLLPIAARLTVEEEPFSAWSNRSYTMFRRFKREIDNGRLDVIQLNGERANVRTIVSKNGLTELARRIGLRSKFLGTE